ncbi:MAG: dihydroorotate dehydrogenase electron transfer subunit [Thermoplasmatota archaeon]
MTKIDIVEITDIVQQTPTTKTLFFDWSKGIKPGQFVMVWIPGVDEIPMSLSHIYNRQGITVKKVGGATQALHNMGIGGRIGIRGPYGKGYDLKGENILAVIGGVGAASIRPAIVEGDNKGNNIKCAVGAETGEELLFKYDFSKLTHLHISTDDGSVGHMGFVTDICENIIDKDIDLIITCGPEMMMKKTADMAIKEGIPVQVSLERYMKCGLGLCDSCSINGYQVCSDGPVFHTEDIKKMDEFGNFERDKTGRKKAICQ